MSRIAIIVDNPTRDLSGAVLLGRELALRGEEVFLTSMNLRHREIPALAPDHLVVNYLRPTNDAFVEQLMHAGVRVTVLDTEGAVFQEPELVEVIALAPDGPPSRVQRNGAAFDVVTSFGPERIGAPWWKGGSGSGVRDYFCVEDQEGRWFWLVLDLSGRWFLHGEWI